MMDNDTLLTEYHEFVIQETDLNISIENLQTERGELLAQIDSIDEAQKCLEIKLIETREQLRQYCWIK